MCVHTSLSQDGFHRKGVWVEHPLASFPFGLQGAFLCMCGQGSLLTSRMRNMWSGRALPPHLIVLLLSSWIFSPQGMNLQSLYPVGSWGSIYLLPHLEDVNHKNKKQTKKPSSSISWVLYSLFPALPCYLTRRKSGGSSPGLLSFPVTYLAYFHFKCMSPSNYIVHLFVHLLSVPSHKANGVQPYNAFESSGTLFFF